MHCFKNIFEPNSTTGQSVTAEMTNKLADTVRPTPSKEMSDNCIMAAKDDTIPRKQKVTRVAHSPSMRQRVAAEPYSPPRAKNKRQEYMRNVTARQYTVAI